MRYWRTVLIAVFGLWSIFFLLGQSAAQDTHRQDVHGQLAKAPEPILGFEGISMQEANRIPPDTVGDVGPNHYVQMVNVSYAVYDKSGTKLLGPTPINTLWSDTTTDEHQVCREEFNTDVIVLYDRMADRWFMGYVAATLDSDNQRVAPYAVCIAISKTPDPAGDYSIYSYDTDVFADYLKFAVWSDAYYMTAKQETGVGVYAFERGNMLKGEPAAMLKVREPLRQNFTLPADLDGPLAPPDGSPMYFYSVLERSAYGLPDVVKVCSFEADFVEQKITLASERQDIDADFLFLVCTDDSGHPLQECIPQKGTDQKLDAIAEWPMWRLQYRNFGTHETLVGNFTARVDDTGEQAGIYWFELQKQAGSDTWEMHNQATYAPDDLHRWMGSIAMDQSGNIALGYSVSGSDLYPSIRYTTRLATDAQHTLQEETSLIEGTASQVETERANRWGDYSSMNVDPADDCTFWYTNQYLTDSSKGWQTYVGAFKIPSCTTQYGVTLTPYSETMTGAIGESTQYTLEVTNQSAATETFDITLGDSSWPVTFTLASQPYVVYDTSFPASVELSAGASETVVVEMAIPASASDGDSDSVDMTVALQGDAIAHDRAVLTTIAEEIQPSIEDKIAEADPEVVGFGEVSQSVAVGDVASYTLAITNTSETAASFVVRAEGVWETEVDQTPDVATAEIAPGERAEVTVDVHVPADAQHNSSDTSTVTVALDGSTSGKQATFALTTVALVETPDETIEDKIEQEDPEVIGFDEMSQSALAGHVVTYTLEITNTSETAASFVIRAAGVWETKVNQTPDVATIAVAPGEKVEVLIEVLIPSGTADSSSDTTVVTVSLEGSTSDKQGSFSLTTVAGRSSPLEHNVYLPLVVG